jgi:hypothetical protein
MARIYSGVMFLCALLHVGAVTCLGVDKIDFGSLREAHWQHYELIRTGALELRYTEYEAVTERELRQVADDKQTAWEAIKQNILADPKLSPAAKNKIIAESERSYTEIPEFFRQAERRKDLYQKYTFDFRTVPRHKLEQQSVDPKFFEKTGLRLPQVILRTEGTQLCYYQDIDRVTINENLASVLPVYLGVIAPARFKEFPGNIDITEGHLDGQAVVIYELSEPGRDSKLRIYADPAIGYRYRKIEGLFGGKVVREIIAKDYRVFDGIPFPAFHEDTTYSSDPNRPVRKRETIQVTNARFNHDIGTDAFKIQFTTNTQADPWMFKLCPDRPAKLGLEEVLELQRQFSRSTGTQVKQIEPAGK